MQNQAKGQTGKQKMKEPKGGESHGEELPQKVRRKKEEGRDSGIQLVEAVSQSH